MHSNYVAEQCEHIRDTGIRCGSPAMRGRDFCYYHYRMHDSTVTPGDSAYVLPALESEQAIQLAATHILRSMLKGKIDRADAATMFQGIRIALISLRTQINVEEKRHFDRIEHELTPAMERLCGTDIPVCAFDKISTEPQPVVGLASCA